MKKGSTRRHGARIGGLAGTTEHRLNHCNGIGGHAAFRDQPVLLYFVLTDRDSGRRQRPAMAPLRPKRFPLNRPASGETDPMAATRDRERRALGAGVERTADGGLGFGVDTIGEATAMYRDRTDAGQQLARALEHLKAEAPVVVALPRGGVPVAYEVAKALQAPLDLALVRKIGAPGQPELAIGAVVDGENLHVFVNRDIAALFRGWEQYIGAETQKKIQEIEERRRRYFGGRSRPRLKGRTVILVDDGIATGATMRAAVASLRQSQVARLIIGVPVAPPETMAALAAEVDAVICLETPEFFSAVGQFYEDFSQTTDDEVVEFLRLAAASQQGTGGR